MLILHGPAARVGDPRDFWQTTELDLRNPIGCKTGTACLAAFRSTTQTVYFSAWRAHHNKSAPSVLQLCDHKTGCFCSDRSRNGFSPCKRVPVQSHNSFLNQRSRKVVVRFHRNHFCTVWEPCFLCLFQTSLLLFLFEWRHGNYKCLVCWSQVWRFNAQTFLSLSFWVCSTSLVCKHKLKSSGFNPPVVVISQQIDCPASQSRCSVDSFRHQFPIPTKTDSFLRKTKTARTCDKTTFVVLRLSNICPFLMTNEASTESCGGKSGTLHWEFFDWLKSKKGLLRDFYTRQPDTYCWDLPSLYDSLKGSMSTGRSCSNILDCGTWSTRRARPRGTCRRSRNSSSGRVAETRPHSGPTNPRPAPPSTPSRSAANTKNSASSLCVFQSMTQCCLFSNKTFSDKSKKFWQCQDEQLIMCRSQHNFVSERF